VNRDEALETVKESILRVVPDADFTQITPEEPFREPLEIDSLDFLNFVEVLGERTGLSIDEDDYPRLTTLSDAADFLLSRA
jgi:acyl carrier protein